MPRIFKRHCQGRDCLWLLWTEECVKTRHNIKSGHNKLRRGDQLVDWHSGHQPDIDFSSLISDMCCFKLIFTAQVFVISSFVNIWYLRTMPSIPGNECVCDIAWKKSCKEIFYKDNILSCLIFFRPSRTSWILVTISQTKENPNRLLSQPAAETGAGVWEESVRGRSGEEGAGKVSQLVRNSGKDEKVTKVT